MSINPGDPVVVSTDPGFKDFAGALGNPTTVKLRWKYENGPETLWTAPDPNISNPSAGIFTAVITPTQVGRIRFQWEGSGGITAVESGYFDVVDDFGAAAQMVVAGAYLTPERFRTMRTGASLKNVSDLELADTIETATDIADAYCNVPLSAGQAAFLGGSVVGEQHRWRYPMTNLERVIQRKIWPFYWPIRAVTGVRLVVGAGLNVVINPLQTVIDNTAKSVEIISFAMANVSGAFGLVQYLGIEQPVSEIDYSFGWGFPYSDERLRPVSPGESLVFQASNGFWDPTIAPVVKVNGVADPSGVIDYDTGRVTFPAVPAGPVTVSYVARLPRAIPKAVAMITADLLGDSALRAKGFVGVDSITVKEVSIRKTQHSGSINEMLERSVPEAAQLLAGYRYWRLA